MKDVFVLDTSALLYHSHVIHHFADSEIIIPSTVLSELDKLKTSRSDRRILYKVREVSRKLFELAGRGDLSHGVTLKNGATVRVARIDGHETVPEALKTKAADDRIIALALRLKEQSTDCRVHVVTSDLGMLVKAQSFGIEIERLEEELSARERLVSFVGRSQRTILNVFLVLVLLALLGLTLVIWSSTNGPEEFSEAPPRLVEQIQAFKQREGQFLAMTKQNPNDPAAGLALANLYFDAQKYESAAPYYRKVLALDPKSAMARTRLALSYFRLGLVHESYEELLKAVAVGPADAEAHYYLGYILWQNRGDPVKARREFETYKELAPSGEHALEVDHYLELIKSGGK